MIEFIYNDGGRADAGFIGTAGDCVTRAIAIVTGKPYLEVYNDLFSDIKDFAQGRSKAAKRAGRKTGLRGTTPRNGVHRKVYHPYLLSLGMKWIPTMLIGQGCKTHLRADELPAGRLIVVVSKHLTAVIDGIIHDIYNPAREAHCTRPNDNSPLKQGEWLHPDGDVICSIQERCVYGYYTY